MSKSKKFWEIRNNTLDLAQNTLIMGIINTTPDSFSDGGKFNSVDSAVEHAYRLQQQGVDILDIGGESTRPGADPVSEQQELDRVIPVIERLKDISIPISVDTWKSGIAKHALDAGAHIVNDISGLHFDPEMAKVVAEYQAGLVVMHTKGTPRNMQSNPVYKELIAEIKTYLQNSLQIALNAGISKQQIVIDPGIGFGKTLEDNFKIIRELKSFKDLDLPILLGPSRKSFIGNTLNLPPDQRLEGTIAAITAGILNGADIVRVHDVLECKRAAIIADKIK